VEDSVKQPQPGEKLRQAREARGLSVDDVAASLKLNAEKIHALEQSDIDGLAAPVFIAGYLRTYARLLELPEEEVLADFEQFMPEQEEIIDPESSEEEKSYAKVAPGISLHTSSSSHHALVVGLVLVAGMIFFLWPSSDNVPTRLVEVKQAENVAEQQAEPADEQVADAGAEMAVATSAENVTGVASQSEQENVPATVTEQSTEQETSTAPIASFDALALGMKSELTLMFSEDSWVEVKDARGERLVYRLARAGSTRSVTGVAPFVVQLGYAPGVNIMYNGEEFDMSKYANRRSVRLRIGEAGDRMGGD
jgi:cytoskeleton protein RodZ